MEYRLEELFDLQMGKTPSRNNPEYWNTEDNKWISIADLSKCSKYIETTKEYLSDKAVEESGISQIPANTVIMSFKLSIGKTAITPEPMYSNEAIMSFRDKHIVELLPDYLYYLFSGKDWDIGTNKAVMGKTLNKATLSKVKVNIHDIEKQKEIVNVLDKVSGIISSRQQELQKIDDLVKSRFIEMFGDVLKNDKKFDVCPFGDYVNQMNIGPFGSDLKNECFVPKEQGYCMVYEQKHAIDKDMSVEARYVNQDKYNHLKRFDIGPGDIIVSCRGTIGECFILPDDAPHGIIHPSLMMIKPKPEVNHKFLVFLLEHILAEQNEQGSGVKMAIKATELAKITTIKPSREIQDKFILLVEQIDKSKFVVQKALKEAQLLFDSLMQKYFG